MHLIHNLFIYLLFYVLFHDSACQKKKQMANSVTISSTYFMVQTTSIMNEMYQVIDKMNQEQNAEISG